MGLLKKLGLGIGTLILAGASLFNSGCATEKPIQKIIDPVQKTQESGIYYKIDPVRKAQESVIYHKVLVKEINRIIKKTEDPAIKEELMEDRDWYKKVIKAKEKEYHEALVKQEKARQQALANVEQPQQKNSLLAQIAEGYMLPPMQISENVEQPSKSLEQVTKSWAYDMKSIRNDALKQGEEYETEFKEELERIKQGKTQSYERLKNLYTQLQEQIKKEYEAEIIKLEKEQEKIERAYEEANEALKKEKEKYQKSLSK